MTTPKVRAAWPISFSPADLQRAPHGDRTSQAAIIATGNVLGIYDDNPGEGTWDYRIRHPSGDSGEWGPWASIAVATPGPLPKGTWAVKCIDSRGWNVYGSGDWIITTGGTLAASMGKLRVFPIVEGLTRPDGAVIVVGGTSHVVSSEWHNNETVFAPSAINCQTTTYNQWRDDDSAITQTEWNKGLSVS